MHSHASFSMLLLTSSVCECELECIILIFLQSFDRSIEDQDLQREIERRMSGSFASSGLFSLNMSDTDKAVDVTIDRAVSYGCESCDYHVTIL